MNDDIEYIEALNNAILAHEKIKKQAVQAIKSLNNELSPHRFSKAALMFYKSSLNRTKKEINAINTEAGRSRDVLIPYFLQNLEKLKKEQTNLTDRINFNQKIRQHRTDTIKSMKTLFSLLENELITVESEIVRNRTEIRVLKQDLRASQLQNLRERKETAQSEWFEELTIEKQNNLSFHGRFRRMSENDSQSATTSFQSYRNPKEFVEKCVSSYMPYSKFCNRPQSLS